MTKHVTGASEVERDLRQMKTASQALTERTMTDSVRKELGAPKIVDRSTFQAELDALRVREKAHTPTSDQQSIPPLVYFRGELETITEPSPVKSDSRNVALGPHGADSHIPKIPFVAI